ncbi:MAG: alpha/beta fold hydrolase [Pseudolabrys sp.]
MRDRYTDTRLEGLAEPGGVCISDIVHQTVLDRLNEPFRDMGGQRVKNISRPIKVWQWTPNAAPQRETPEVGLKQRVQFTTSADGTQIAWASVGDGPPVFKAPNYLNHIEYEWTSPFWGPFLAEFARNNRLVRFDQRGNGLSDWEIERISSEAMIEDMEAVVAAAGLEHFALFGISQGAAFSVRYAVKHPEKVSCLIIFNGFMRGRKARGNAENESIHNVAQMMIREGWGSTNPIYRNFFTSSFLPDAPQEIKNSFDELQRISCSAQNVMRINEMNSMVNDSEIAQQVRVPTLVLHITGDNQVPVSEGRLTARLIPGAQFVELPGNNHVALEGQPCFNMFFDEVRTFLAAHG